MNATLSVLQAVRLKGRLLPEALSTVTVLPAEDAAAALSVLLDAGHLVQPKPDGPLRITPEGREELRRLLQVERVELDQESLTATYDDFGPLNLRVKAVVSAWQMRDETTPNDHSDQSYDAGVVAQLATVHADCGPMLEAAVTVVPRLAHYPRRLTSAIDAVLAGDTTFIARPTVDSHHQVWFELHEELMDCLGLTRHDEAAAGRA
jgi:pyruvate,orthophosphate dikinase